MNIRKNDAKNRQVFTPSHVQPIESANNKSWNNSSDVTYDNIFLKCLLLCIREQFASTSLLQRKMSMGYIKAANYLIKMEELGYISKEIINNRKSVLLTKDDFDKLYGDIKID